MVTDEYLSYGLSYDVDGNLVDKRDELLTEAQVALAKAKERHIEKLQRERYERELRIKHPSLNDAWEKYQSILRLVEDVRKR